MIYPADRVYRVHLSSCDPRWSALSPPPSASILSGGDEVDISFRSAFVARRGCVLLSADYAQVELRVLAHLSGDSHLVQAFLERAPEPVAVSAVSAAVNVTVNAAANSAANATNAPALAASTANPAASAASSPSSSRAEGARDLFRLVATRLFDCPYAAVTEQMRAVVKAVTYAQLYGAGIKSVAEAHGLPQDKVRHVVEQWRARYPRVQAYLEEVKHQCRKCGYIETIAGRRRYLPEIRSADEGKRAAACRQAINSTIQGSAADLIKQAMLRIDRELTPQHGPALQSARTGRLLLQIHDELLFEVEEGRAEQLQAIVRAAMQEATLVEGKPLRVPLKVALKHGRSWGTLKLVEEVESATQAS